MKTHTNYAAEEAAHANALNGTSKAKDQSRFDQKPRLLLMGLKRYSQPSSYTLSSADDNPTEAENHQSPMSSSAR